MPETSYARRLRARGNDYRRDTPRDRRFQRPYAYWDATAHSCTPVVVLLFPEPVREAFRRMIHAAELVAAELSCVPDRMAAVVDAKVRIW